MIAALASSGFALMGAAPVPLDLAAAPSAGPSASPSPGTTAFTLDAPAFSPSNAVRLSGGKDAGSSVSVKLPSGVVACTIRATAATAWDCIANIPSGADIRISAVQTLSAVDSDPISATFDVIGTPTIDGSPGYRTSGLVSGYGLAGATVTVAVGGNSVGCSSVATSAGYWSCPLALASGPYTITAAQSRSDIGSGASSSASGSLTILIDRDAPPRPAITSPAAGATVRGSNVLFAGTGESGGIADLYIDSVPVCETDVVGGGWTCTVASVAPGIHATLVILRDAAGNYSSPSAPISVTVAVPPAGSPPVPKPTATPRPRPSSPAAAPVPASPVPSPSDSATTPPAIPTDPAAPAAGPPTDWGTPTAFGASLPTLVDSVTHGNWLVAPVLALAFILLIALPLRMLTTVLRGRISLPAVRLTGRNRGRTEPDTPATPVNPWIAGAVPIAVAAGLIIVTVGVDDQVRYARLVVAIVLGLSILNVVGVAVATRLGSRAVGVSGRLRFVPLLMVAAVVAALLSRWTGIQPPVVTGVLIGVGFTNLVGRRAQAVVGLVEIGAVTLLATVAWTLHGLVAASTGFWTQLAAETLATVALAGFGSAIVLVLPIASLPGRAVFDWSRPAWLGAVVVVSLVGSAMILGRSGAAFPVIGAMLVGGAFAAVSVAVWGWLRFVEPAVASA